MKYIALFSQKKKMNLRMLSTDVVTLVLKILIKTGLTYPIFSKGESLIISIGKSFTSLSSTGNNYITVLIICSIGYSMHSTGNGLFCCV